VTARSTSGIAINQGYVPPEALMLRLPDFDHLVSINRLVRTRAADIAWSNLLGLLNAPVKSWLNSGKVLGAH
jgi:hypothetical protein